MSSTYLSPAGEQRFEIEIRRSRFITTLAPVNDKASARQFIARVRHHYPDANHHCWAMIAGLPTDVYQQDQSDDGEPKGTAGKPMLNVLQHADIGNTAVVVTRYFGGIKLGTGGLVRAYTRSVSEALKSATLTQVQVTVPATVCLAYAQLDTFEHWLKSTDISIVDRQFDEAVTLLLTVPETDIATLRERAASVGATVTFTTEPR